MAYEPERVVIELLAKNEQFDAAAKSSASTYDKSMDRIERAGAKAEKSFVQGSSKRSSAIQKESREISRASQIIGTQINDISGLLSSPKSPFVSIPKQAPTVASAMRVVSLGATALGGVLGGALALGAVAGLEALLNLASGANTLEGRINSLVDKLKENAQKTREAEIANDIFATTIEGVTQAIRDDDEALRKLNQTNVTAARQALVNAERRLLTLQGIRDETQALIDQARAQDALNRAQLEKGGRANFELAAAKSQETGANLDRLEARLKRVDGLITKQQGRITEALASRVVELAGEDKLEGIKRKFDSMIDAARKRAIAEGTVRTTLAAQVRELEKQKEAALEIERSRKRAAAAEDRAGRQAGRQITEADARRIVAGIGGQVTSGFRTPEHNKRVGGQATSFHLKGQAIDIAKTAGLTLGKIVQAFEKEGVKLIEKLDEGDHFHIAFGKRGGAGPSAETLARRAQAAADAEERRLQSYQNELATLQDDEVQARQALITAADEIAQLEIASIEISRAKYEDNVKSLVEQRKLKDDEAAELLKLNEERAKLRKELVNRREDERKFRLAEQQAKNAADIKSAQIQTESDLLRGQLSLANTQRERRDIEKRLLDLQFQEERAALEAVIAHNERLKLQKNIMESERIEAEAAAQIAKIRLGSLEERQANATAANDRANASPLDAYFGNIQQQAGDINTAFESIAAGGLATFTDALTDAIVNFRSLGDVGRAVLQNIVAGLVKLAIQQVILATIGKALGAGATAATSTEAAAAATAWAPAAAAASLATLGANAGPAAAALAGTHALSFALSQAGRAAGFARGGRIYGPGSSTSDDVPLWGSRDEYMIKAKSARTLGYDTLEHINRTGKLPGFAEGGRVRAVRPMNMPAASPHRGGGFGPSDMAALRGIVGEAVAAGINAMPDVNNFIGFDAEALLVRALGTRGGQRALVAAYGRNQTAIKAQR